MDGNQANNARRLVQKPNFDKPPGSSYEDQADLWDVAKEAENKSKESERAAFPLPERGSENLAATADGLQWRKASSATAPA